MDSGDWDDLRREARRLEGDLDVRLSSYGKLGGLLSLFALFLSLISSPILVELACTDPQRVMLMRELR